MAFYKVGGAVRDRLLGREVQDVDYVVTGATPEQMLKLNFTQVGADFPVFLDSYGNEIALARTERKSGAGYLGFETDFSPQVTLEDDLFRRDLTINAMAETGQGDIVDPFNGRQDLDYKVLRHVSDAFAEDPVRVLRVARFRARMGPEWTVAPETVDLMASMTKKGVLDELVPERVWKEMSRALMEDHPRLFFDTLLETDALHVVFPEVYRLKTALESRKWHPEGDAYEHTMLVLTQAALQGFDLESRYAALVHDFGKGVTPRDRLPKHYGHDVNGVPVVEEFSNRLTVPSKMRDRAMKATRFHMHMHKLDIMNSKTIVKMFDNMGARNDPDSVTVLLNVGRADERGRLGSENASVEQLKRLLTFYEAYSSVKFYDVFPNGEKKPAKIQHKLKMARIAAVKEHTRSG